MNYALTLLVARRDRVVRVAKLALLAATALWLMAIALYDGRVDAAGIGRDFLLTTRGGMLVALARVEPLPLRRIWGGPWTLFGVKSVAGALGMIGLVALFRRRMNSGYLSRWGLASAAAGMALAILAAQEERWGVYPVTVDRAGLQRLLAFVDAREPDLIPRLCAGERPDLPDHGGASMRLVGTADGRIIPDLPPGQPLLRDRADAEGLRFLLAEQAYAEHDRSTLRRLLPIALAMPPTDRPARGDFARRLAAMGRMAGAPAMPPVERSWVAAEAARWRAMAGVSAALRHLMVACLLVGGVASVIALVLRRRVASIRRHATALPAREARPAFGQRVTEA